MARSCPAKTKRRELGDFLRAHRARLSPASLGLPDRRAAAARPACRREEVAQLSGVSAHLVHLDRAGPRSVGLRHVGLVSARLAEALHLTAAERAYLFDLAGKRDPKFGGRSGGRRAPL